MTRDIFTPVCYKKNALAAVNDTVRVYAPEGVEVKQYLNNIHSYNQRTESPTAWKEEAYIGEDYLSRMLSDRKGDVVVLAGNNQKKDKIYSGSDQSRLPCSFRQTVGYQQAGF